MFNKKQLKKFSFGAKYLPAGSDSKYTTFGKTGLAVALTPVLGPANPLAYDPDVMGARGSAKEFGRSVDQAKDKKKSEAAAVAAQQAADAAAAAAAAEEPFSVAKESQRKGLLRKGRRASILTSSQGASDPLGIPG